MVAFPLPLVAREAGYRVIGFDSIGSTNAEAITAARAGEADKLWFAALQQTTGRGRRGRAWESPYGNLAASLLIQPNVPSAALASLGFVAGVALNDALSRLLPDVSMRSGVDGADGRIGRSAARIALKWPNDLLADGAKLAGILLEAIPRQYGHTAVVIGIGVNVVAAPQGLPYPAVALSSFNPAIDAAMVFETLAESWVRWYDVWDNGQGTARIIERWRDNAAGIGSEVVVQRSQGVLRGIFESIDDAGHLIVRDDEGQRIAITAGDVHFGTTATLR
ncbi:biotin--[acetyl-CoA-carboxylase] ligase [Pelagibacterium luteolum]|uniref:biotin--[biotin carboxyl-carrier protein] ligase n=1 Tax=Pelagibacterium luteolum TaxID=440168 RepID=A0A1G7W9G8_9HYPH|nr:biotin--[acetyl-CoA-carboxylase] ligase [Pelagibacterium luteolum]SDG68613.1 BirA family transcriptional regulator, biotin operon repressor / biotin-[acetyl-CoA-carboxylase] ligase [Pelagibacterium luteolum]